MSDGTGNGDGAARDVKLETLVLTYDRARDHLEVGGHVNSTDLMLDMISRAKRILEAKWRLEYMAAMQGAAVDAALREKIAREGGRR